jgi:uncharacterized protein (DUF169 family)
MTRCSRNYAKICTNEREAEGIRTHEVVVAGLIGDVGEIVEVMASVHHTAETPPMT